jgi:cytochrome oxidase assembly protein ShyY1
MTLFVACMLPIVVSLAFWQLERAALKQSYEAQYFARMGLPPQPAPDKLDDAAFQRITLDGQFDPDIYFLVDNQIHQGRPGYWVVALFIDVEGRRWLVNRGWIAGQRLRDQLPDVTIPGERVRIVGALWPDTGMVPLLDEDIWSDGWPKRVQRLDVPRMALLADASLDAELRLEAGQPGILVPAALGVDFKARTHQGYAAQWFGLAIVLILGYIVFGFRRNE